MARIYSKFLGEKMLAFLGIALIFIGCYKEQNYVQLNGNDIIRIISIEPVNTLADSASQIAINLEISDLASSNVEVTVETNLGSFQNKEKQIKLTANADEKIKLLLYPGLEHGIVEINAIIFDTIRIDTTFKFDKSYPDIIYLTPEVHEAAFDTEVECDLEFFKFVGFMSRNQNIRLLAQDSDGNSVGEFSLVNGIQPGAKNKCKFIPTAGYKGNVYLIVQLYKEDGEKIEVEKKVLLF